jgi:zinc protease
MKSVPGLHRTALPVLLAFCSFASYARADQPAASQAKPAETPAGIKKGVTIEGITEYRLDNGARLLLFPDPSSSTVTINMTVMVGSRHEGYGETGMAHLLEHMLFKGTPTFPKIDKVLQEHGANNTANATTWLDRTTYFETMPATDKNLEFGIRLEADRLVNSYVKHEDLAKEMTVVRNEFEMNENNPETVLSQRMNSAAFEWHNYGKATIGNRTDIERVPIDKLQRFYRKYYQPDNIVVTIAGKFDTAKALEYMNRYFGALKRPGRTLEQTYTEEPPQDGERTVILRRVGKVAVVGVLYHVPAAAHADFAAVDVLSSVLLSEPSGLLYKALVETKKATSVNGGVAGLHDPGTLEITARVADGVKPEEVRDIMLNELEKLAAGKITEADVARAKRKLLAERERSLTKSRGIAIELAEWIGDGDWRLLFLHRDRIAKVTLADVQRVARQYLQRSNRTVGMYLPATEFARTPIPEAPPLDVVLKDYKGQTQSAQGEQFEPTPANLEKRTRRTQLPVGLKVALMPKKTRGQAVVGNLTLHFGNEASLQGQTVAAEVVGPLMVRGTSKHTREQIEDELDKLGSTLNASSGTGQLTFSFQTTRANLPALLELLHEILRTPTFPEPEFEILKRAERQDLEKQIPEPQPQAINFLRRRLSPYPRDNVRYVPTIQESIGRLDAVTRDQVVRVYQEQVGAQVGEFALVGDFDPEATLKQLPGIVNDWKAAVPYQRIATQANTHVTGALEKILTPDKENAIYVAGELLALKDTDPPYPALLMGNYILGASGFNSRIMDLLRQEKGLSYSAGSSFSADAQDPRAQFVLYAIYNPKNLAKVDHGMSEVVARLLKDGVTAEELAASKKGYAEERKVARSNDHSLVSMLVNGLYLGRTFGFAAAQDARVAGTTIDEVNQALRRYLDPKRFVIVRAGDFKKNAAPGANP